MKVRHTQAYHWRIQRGAASACPPTGSISFIFAYVFAEKCMCQRLAPPNGSVPPQWEILDPPLGLCISPHSWCCLTGNELI